MKKNMDRNMTIHGLRGLCALLVVFAHVYGMSVTGGLLQGKTSLGLIGVNIFFMISGFVIPLSLLKHDNIKEFFINRIIRIYPVFLTLHLIVFATGPIIGYEWFKNISIFEYIKNFLTNLFMLPGMFRIPIAQKNAWSLSYEFAFYVAMSVLFYLVMNQKQKQKMVKTILYLFWATAVLILIYTHKPMIFFAIGWLGFYLSYKNININNMNNTLAFICPFVFALMLAIPRNIFAYLILGTLFFLPVVKQQGIMSKLLRTKFFKYYGDISYSLYLIHPFALYPLKLVFSKFSGYIIANNLVYYVILCFGTVGLLLATFLSHFSYLYIEQWLTKNVIRKALARPLDISGMRQHQ
ncbi:MAG TPA: acyltransferase [Methylomusa anaerophila]|uniref:Acyltransferase family protein n=1 Tax=Methylomusa anaerophila TaxID=1930071 RepID=A0A348AGB5_9FIRM|nr:acyltransferase [Methylomusa anaerophila]BBB90113.1 acyltransferase family protein [Methylomusa anaerophila]HML88163.1 acyltransferase [Methylomusa anaerophila]